jgi:hypothetical protein
MDIADRCGVSIQTVQYRLNTGFLPARDVKFGGRVCWSAELVSQVVAYFNEDYHPRETVTHIKPEVQQLTEMSN